MTQSQTVVRRAVLLARCSTAQRVEYSVPQQIEHMRQFCREESIDVVAEIRLEGVSGLDIEARTDIDQIVQRKSYSQDFDTVVVACVDRLTRGGPNHGFWICHEFDRVGIELVSAKRDLPPAGQYRWLVLGMKFAEANSEISSIVFRLTRGKTAAILDGRLPHTSITPYGLDRLYSTPGGIPLHRIRNLADGTQVMLKPEGEGSDAVIRIFPANEKRGKSRHYKRQADEHVTFVPGDPSQVATVRWIFEKRYIDKWGWHRTALHLNDVAQTPSAKGCLWCAATVLQILSNSVYTGLGMGNRYTGAKLYMQGKDIVPVAANLQPKRAVLVGQKIKFPRNHRKKSDWIPVVYPQLVQFLSNFSPDMREVIQKAQVDHYEHRVTKWNLGLHRKAGGDRHADKSYFLKGLFYSKQDRIPLVARPSGGHRYYARSKALCTPSAEMPFFSVRAEPVETSVLDAVQKAIAAMPSIDALLRSMVEELSDGRGSLSEPDKEALATKKKCLLKDIGILTLANRDLKPEDLMTMIEPKKVELRKLDARLTKAEVQRLPVVPKLDELISKVKKRLGSLAEVARECTAAARLKDLVALVVQRLEIDVWTKEVQLDLQLPTWCMLSSESNDEVLRLVTSKRTLASHQTYWANALPICRMRGTYIRGAKGREAQLTLSAQPN